MLEFLVGYLFGSAASQPSPPPSDTEVFITVMVGAVVAFLLVRAIGRGLKRSV